MTFTEFIQKINRIKNQLDEQTRLATTIGAQSSLSLLKSRIQSEGLAGEEYSEGYALTRKKRGRQTSHVDLTFTGRLMTALKIEGLEGSNHRYIAKIGAGSETDKLKSTGDQYGDWIIPSGEEKEIAQKDFENVIFRLFDDLR